jgi:hypothetical protein
MNEIGDKQRSFELDQRLRGLRQIGRRSTREDLLNVFTPNEPIKNTSKFVGRQKPLEEMINVLLSEGAHSVVFG